MPWRLGQQPRMPRKPRGSGLPGLAALLSRFAPAVLTSSRFVQTTGRALLSRAGGRFAPANLAPFSPPGVVSSVSVAYPNTAPVGRPELTRDEEICFYIVTTTAAVDLTPNRVQSHPHTLR